ncbi:MAG: hypothetical protein AB2A00_40425 [Myxococcota bacterium]
MKRQALLLSLALGLLGCDRGTRQDSRYGYGQDQGASQYSARADKDTGARTDEAYAGSAGDEARDERELSDEARESGKRVEGEAQDMMGDIRRGGEEIRQETREAAEEIKEEGREVREDVRERTEAMGERTEQEVNEELKDLQQAPAPTGEGVVPRKELEEFSDEDIKRLDDRDLRHLTDESLETGGKKVLKDSFENSSLGKIRDYEHRVNIVRDMSRDNADIANEINQLQDKLARARNELRKVENAPVTNYQTEKDALEKTLLDLNQSVAALEARARNLQGK